MASPGCDIGRNSHQHQHQQSESAPEPAFQEAQKWIEEATGRRFGDRDFRSSLENGILLCELLSSIRPGLVKKINRLPTPIAGLDNLCLFLRGCGSLGLKGTQLFDPGDLQDTSVRANLRGSDCSRKLKNVLITIYWLGKAAQNSTSYSGPTLDLKMFEGLLSQMKKDSEDTETLRGSIGDSGYIDSGEAEHSESLSPPHGRGDSFDSLDSLGSPSPDVLIPACSEGRGSDSECDGPRRLPDVQKDDMLTRRTVCAEPHPAAPFNQYLPNKSSTSAYGPAPLRKKRPDPEEVQTSGSTATSPIGGEQPISRVPCMRLGGAQVEGGPIRQKTVTWGGESRAEPALWEGPEEQEVRRMQKLEKAGIRVLPAAVRYLSLKHVAEEEPMEEATPPCPSIVLRKDSDFLQQAEQAWASDEEEEDDEGRRLPDVQKDDLASRRARMSHSAPRVHHFLPSASDGHVREEWEGLRRAWQRAALSESEAHTAPCKEEEEQEGGRGPQALPNLEKDDLSRRRAQSRAPPRAPPQPFINASITPSDLQTWQRLKMSTEPSETPPPEMSHATPCKEEEEQEGGQGPQPLPNLEKDDLSRRRAQSRAPPRAPPQPFINASITPSDLQTWQRLKMSTEPSEEPPVCQACLQKGSVPSEQDHLLPSEQEDHALRPVPAQHSAPSGRPRFVHFGPVTEMDQQLWERLRIAQPGQEEELGVGPGSEAQTLRRLLASAAVATPTIGLSSQLTDKPASADVSDGDSAPLAAADCALDQTSLYEQACRENQALDQKLAHYKEREEEEDDEDAGEREGRQPDLQKDDMLVRRTGTCQKPGTGSSFNRFLPLPGSFRGTPKIKTEALPYTPKTKTEALPSTPQTKTDPPPDIPKIKTEGLPSTPQTEMDTLPDIHKIKTEGMSDTAKPKMEALPNNMQREPFLDSSKSRVKMNLSKPQTRQELSVGTSVLHHPDPQKARTNHPEKRIAASAKPVPGVAEMIQVATAYYGSPDDYDSDEDDEYEEESHPDLGKDDMHARRTGQFQKVPGGGVTPAVNPFLPVPGSVKFKSTPTPTSSPSSPSVKPLESEPVSDAHSSSSLFSAELNCPPVPAATRTTATTTTSTSMTSPITLSPKHSAAPSAPPLPLSSTPQSEPRRRPSWLDDLPPMSVSMTDMRCEETAEQALGEARQELMHSQYNQHREEESQWQDDLARWKNRRRTASQDLIKKEEERKMMERLMVRDDSASQRRKSIKTYKEIVEEKERREQELHDAYSSACSPEEAATVLRRYAQRFTLSDAALERLQLSKPAEPAAPGPAPSAGPTPAAPGPAPSAGPTPAAPGPAPSAGPTPAAPGPAPSPVAPSPGLSSSSGPTPSQTTDSCSVTTTLIPKFSATLETSTVAPVQAYAPSCTPPSKPVPLLTPKPYSQPSSSQRSSISVKADCLLRVNGDAGEPFNRAIRAGPRAGPTTPVQAPPTPVQAPPTAAQASPAPVQTPPTSVYASPTPLQAPPTPVQAPAAQRKDTPPSQPDQEATPSHPRPLPTCHRALGVSQGVYGPAQSPAEPMEGGAHTPGSPLLPEGREKDSSSQVDHWSWDPDEERKRQERWQQKQELLLQERYEQEQEKLKREWEKAQMEVQEEERRHHEEERRILEETMPSLSPRSSTLSSPLRGGLSPPPGPQDLALPSPANMELRQEQPVQAVSPEEALMGQKDRSETHRASLPLTPVLPELNAAPHQNGQSLPAEPSRSTTPQQQPFNSPWSSKQAQNAPQEAEKMQKKTASLDRNLNPQPGRAKRCGSCENVATNSSPANSSSIHPQSPNRSVSGRKLCSSCGLPLGKGAAMIIESLHLCFHIQCFTCGVCKGQLGDTSTGTDVRIRNGLLNCHQCYVKSRAAGQPTIL